jgi:hypothetical protein
MARPRIIIQQCKKCGSKDSKYIKGLCKKCYDHQYYENNINIFKEQSKNYRLEHYDESIEYGRKYWKKNRIELIEKHKHYIEEHRIELNKKRKIYFKTPKGKYSRYKNAAKKRNISFELTFEQFMTFWQQPCYYTGIPIETIGIDRIDNTKGYTIDNCVSCCEEVNYMKNNMTQEHFINQCIKISNRFSIENYSVSNIKIIKKNTNTDRKELNDRYSQYKSESKKRKISFELTKEQFSKYWQKDCYYCGDKIETIGLDRVDNEKEYTLDNIVSCCIFCNKTKWKYSKQEFISMCIKIASVFGILQNKKDTNNYEKIMDSN